MSASFHILSYCPYLRLIDFSSNLLTDQGALSLAKWISLCNGSFSVRFASTFPMLPLILDNPISSVGLSNLLRSKYWESFEINRSLPASLPSR